MSMVDLNEMVREHLAAERYSSSNRTITNLGNEDWVSQTEARFDLSRLDGTNGFTVSGLADFDVAGRAVSGAGDINGDGIDDILIGALGADINNVENAGATYVIFGTANGFNTNFDLTSLNGTNGFTINGIEADENSGFAVSDAGDVNGDGIDDIIIGAPFDDGTSITGKSYVVFGNANGFAASFNLSTLNGSNGFVVDTTAFQAEAGYSVSGGGDYNGDGIDDIIIGARQAGANGQSFVGEAYIVFGSTDGFVAEINSRDLDGLNGFTLQGTTTFDGAGHSVSDAGDVNGDGIDDILVSAFGANPAGRTSAGETYVIFGQTEGFADTIDLADLDGTDGFALRGISSRDQSGVSVAGGGDLNGDGYTDIVIGASEADVGNAIRQGETYVIFGHEGGFDPFVELSDLDGTNGFVINGARFFDESGAAVSFAGDVNGDGFDDILISAKRADPNDLSSAGEVYLVFGKADGFESQLELIKLDGTTGVTFGGLYEGAHTGVAVSSAGDVNADGIDDFIIGSNFADINGITNASQSYIIFGWRPEQAVMREGSQAGQTIHGSDFDDYLSGLGGDDILIGYNGDDSLNGGTGIDYAEFSGERSEYSIVFNENGSVTITHLNDGHDGSDILTHIEYARFSDEDVVLIELATPLTEDADLYTGTGGTDFIDGLGGDDVMNGLGGDDRLLGGTGDDTLNGGSGDDILSGGDGNDLLTGSTGDDTLSGDFGNDWIEGGSGADTLNGGAGADRLYGHGGDDTLDGGADDDRLFGGSGDDVIQGGDGDDVLIGVAGMDELHGGLGDDYLDGGGSDDMLYGGEGNDRLFGRGGEDRLYGGAGDDEMNGGSSADRFFAGDGDDTINGVGGADIIYGEAGDDIINAGGGNDFVLGGAGNDTILGKGGADAINGDEGNDYIDGGTSNDLLRGGDGNDTLIGAGGKDNLFGGEGDDHLNGGGGNDVLQGDAGNDTLTGGAVRDFFIFDDGFGNDTITDFANNLDKIDFSGHSSLNNLAAVLAVASQVGADTVITLDADNTLTLTGFTLANLDANDFIFAGSAAEAQTDKALVSEGLMGPQKSVVADIASIDDSFDFVEKPVIADDLDMVDFHGVTLAQDQLAEFMVAVADLRSQHEVFDAYFEGDSFGDADVIDMFNIL